MYWQTLANTNLNFTKLEGTKKIEEMLSTLSTYRILEELLAIYKQINKEIQSDDKKIILDFEDTDNDTDLFINL